MSEAGLTHSGRTQAARAKQDAALHAWIGGIEREVLILRYGALGRAVPKIAKRRGLPKRPRDKGERVEWAATCRRMLESGDVQG